MRFNYFKPQRFKEFVKTCFRVLESGEPGLFLFAPKTDKVRRISQLIQDFPPSPSTQLIRLELVPHLFETAEDIEFYLAKYLRSKHKKTFIFVSNSENVVAEKNFSLFDTLIDYQEKHPHIRFLFFCETDLTHPDIFKNFSRTHIFSHVIYYPLYDQKDSVSFINYLLTKWSFHINDSLKKSVLKNCGGHLWLIKQAVRHLKDFAKATPHEIFHSEAMDFRLEEIYLSLLPSEQAALQGIITHKKIKDDIHEHSLKYLRNIGLVKKQTIAIPLLAGYISQHLPKMTIDLVNHRILVNNVNLDDHFSKKERAALRLLLSKKNQPATRDEIAQSLWPVKTEERYSDWAIDRLLARLRLKLVELGLPKEIIKAVRGRGYLIET